MAVVESGGRSGDGRWTSGRRTGLLHRGIQLLETAFDLETDAFAKPIQTNLLMARGQAYATVGKFHEAEADYAAAQAIMPDDPMIPFWRSLVLMDLGQIDAGVALCQERIRQRKSYTPRTNG